MLAETQELFRRAVVSGDIGCAAPLLISNGGKRLDIHRRNYQRSLINAILGKFPATSWLVGAAYVSEAAKNFIEQFPPQAPCISEYGEAFPRFLAGRSGSERTPYLLDLAVLEWHIGHATIAADSEAVTLGSLASLDPDALQRVRLEFQPGLRYLHMSWPVDELMKVYLTDSAPDSMVFEPADVFMEIHGSRGELRMTRLAAGAFYFRRALGEGRSIGSAAEMALDHQSAFDPGAELVRLISENGVTAVIHAEDANHE
jgi:hypothetical protein